MEAKLKQKPVAANFSPGESFYLKESKAQSALEFLGQLKDTRGTSVTDQERALILSLQKQGFLDEVISILLLLAYNRDKSLQINERYVLSVAEDFQKQGITSAEEAIVRIQQRLKQGSVSRKQTSFNKQKKQTSPASSSNVPNWSQKNYVDQTTPEEMKAREEERKRMFQQMKGEGN
nr:DnaD domain protein [Streptococcus danieliae]